MESATFVPLWPPLRILRLAGTELTEILGGFGGDVGEELHLDPAQRLAWGRSIRRTRASMRRYRYGRERTSFCAGESIFDIVQ